MAAITVIGATGFAGGAIAREAARRGHRVTGVARTAPAGQEAAPAGQEAAPAGQEAGISWVTGSALDPGVRERAFEDAAVVVAALSPRGDMAGHVARAYADLAALASKEGVRLVVIGGFSALRLEQAGPRLAEAGQVPPEYADEAREMASVADTLRAAPDELDWVYVSPGAVFGAHTGLADRGTYRVGGEVALFDGAGESSVSGGDFAAAVVDEIERKAHRNSHIGVAY